MPYREPCATPCERRNARENLAQRRVNGGTRGDVGTSRWSARRHHGDLPRRIRPARGPRKAAGRSSGRSGGSPKGGSATVSNAGFRKEACKAEPAAVVACAGADEQVVPIRGAPRVHAAPSAMAGWMCARASAGEASPAAAGSARYARGSGRTHLWVRALRAEGRVSGGWPLR